jgi:hypothetical protein
MLLSYVMNPQMIHDSDAGEKKFCVSYVPSSLLSVDFWLHHMIHIIILQRKLEEVCSLMNLHVLVDCDHVIN